jgi:hypothetical protein
MFHMVLGTPKQAEESGFRFTEKLFQREANHSVMNFEGMGIFTLPEKFI